MYIFRYFCSAFAVRLDRRSFESYANYNVALAPLPEDTEIAERNEKSNRYSCVDMQMAHVSVSTCAFWSLVYSSQS